MKILCIDTSTKTCSCAVCEDERVLCAKTLDEGLTHSETLMPLIDELLTQAGVDVSEIGLAAVVNGPGSFTGIRIGVCAAKGFAQTLNIPVAVVDTLELLSKNAGDFDGVVAAMLDARRGNVYAALFENGKRITEDMAVPVEEFTALMGDRRALFVGDGAAALRDRILAVKPDALFCGDDFPRAERMPGIALSRAFTDAAGVVPNYIRESRAEKKQA